MLYIWFSLTPREFNSYGARRGNDAVMTRGTFAHKASKPPHWEDRTQNTAHSFRTDGQWLDWTGLNLILRSLFSWFDVCFCFLITAGCVWSCWTLSEGWSSSHHPGRKRVRLRQLTRLGRQRTLFNGTGPIILFPRNYLLFCSFLWLILSKHLAYGLSWLGYLGCPCGDSGELWEDS